MLDPRAEVADAPYWSSVLTCRTDTPNPDLGAYVHAFLLDAPWLRRRVETVSFLDVDTVLRRNTLDVGIAEVREATTRAPMYPQRPLVPLAVLRKDLLLDFDLRDRHGSALAVAPRDVDACFATSALCTEASKVLGVELFDHNRSAPLTDIVQHLNSITFRFPHPEDRPDSAALRSWETPSTWVNKDHLGGSAGSGVLGTLGG